MARLVEILPRKLVAMVLLPLVLGLGLLVALVDLPSAVWAGIYVVVIGGLLVMVLLVVHVHLLETQQGEVSED